LQLAILCKHTSLLLGFDSQSRRLNRLPASWLGHSAPGTTAAMRLLVRQAGRQAGRQASSCEWQIITAAEDGEIQCWESGHAYAHTLQMADAPPAREHANLYDSQVIFDASRGRSLAGVGLVLASSCAEMTAPAAGTGGGS